MLAVSADGRFAVGSGRTDEDAPSQARAAISTGTAQDITAAPAAVAGAQATLAAAYLDRRLVLVTGTSPAGDACCSSAATVAGTGAAHTLTADLEGTTTAALVPVRGGLLAAVDNQAGITVARSNGAASFARGVSLVGSDPTPPLMAVGSLADGGAIVAWTAPAPAAGAQTVTGTTTAPGSTTTTAAGYDQPRNPLIRFAVAGPGGLPGAARLAVTVPSGREIEALAVVPHRRGATLAWTESWYAGMRYVSEVFWTDVGAGSTPQASELSPSSTVAVGVSLAGASDGHEVLAWQACDVGAGTCRTDAALRPHGDAWGTVRSLGGVDPTSFPVATESAGGEALVGWVANGGVRAAAANPAATNFHPSVAVTRADGDSDLALGFGADATQAIAVWVQGTYDQKLVGARFSP